MMDTTMDNVQNVKWLDYTKNLMDIQKSIYLSSSMFDVIISVGETRFKAHQLVLSACSDFFIDILANCSNSIIPTIIIPDINPKLFDPLLVFIYTGETYVTSNSFAEFLDLCRFLKIKGFPPPMEQPTPPPLAPLSSLSSSSSSSSSSLTSPPLATTTPQSLMLDDENIVATAAAATISPLPPLEQNQLLQNTSQIVFFPNQLIKNIKSQQLKTVSSNENNNIINQTVAAAGSGDDCNKMIKNNFIIENSLENITNIDDLVIEEGEDEDEEQLEEELELNECDVDGEDVNKNIDDEEQFEVVEIYENSSTGGHEECISETKLIVEEFLDDDLLSQHHQQEPHHETTPTTSLSIQNNNKTSNNTNIMETNSCLTTPSMLIPKNEFENSTTNTNSDEYLDKKVDLQKSQQKLSTTKQQHNHQQFNNEHLNHIFDALKNGKSIGDIAIEFGISKTSIYSKLRENPEYRLMYRSLRTRIIEDAVHAVTVNGISRKEASAKFNISKTVLWRKLKQSNLYRPEERVKNASRTEAVNEMAKGETLVSVSKKYNIPLSTLHRYKVRLYSEGKLPIHCKLTRRDSGPGYKKRVRAAVESCEKGMPQKIASELHGVPKTTIWRHLHAAAKRKQQQQLDQQQQHANSDDGSRNGEEDIDDMLDDLVNEGIIEEENYEIKEEDDQEND